MIDGNKRRNLSRDQIIKWLRQLSNFQLKDVLSIKYQYIKKYWDLILQKQGKKCFEQSLGVQLDDKQMLFCSQNYRFSKNQQQKNAAASKIFENLLILRQDQIGVSLKMQFLKQDWLEQMKIISDDLIFVYHKQNLHKIGLKSISVWFNPKETHSFVEYIVHAFQFSILSAYDKRNKERPNFISVWTKCQQLVDFPKLISKCINKTTNNSLKCKKQINCSDKNILEACILQRFKQNYFSYERIFQYPWRSEIVDKTEHQTLKLIAIQLSKKNEQLMLEKEIQDINKKNQKKRKKSKKSILTKESFPSDQPPSKLKIVVQKNEQERPKQILNELQIKNKDQAETIMSCNSYEDQILNHKMLQEESKNNYFESKLINTYINEGIEYYIKSMIQTSQRVQIHRQAIYSLIQQSINEMNLKTHWQLCLYGSCAVKFALKESDIDLILKVQEQICTLEDIFLCLKVKPWVIDCHFIKTAFIPIINFRINLQLVEIKNLTPHQLKRLNKINKRIFEVDLTLNQKNQKTKGFECTKTLKTVLDKNQIIVKTCLFLKKIFRNRKLHKPYQGGINSYTLVMLAYGILRQKRLLNSQDICTNLFQISWFMFKEFQPFETLIKTTQGFTSLKPDCRIHLNIEDPATKLLIKTSAFQIFYIIKEFQLLFQFLLDLQKQIQGMNINQRKKIRKFIQAKLDKFVQL